MFGSIVKLLERKIAGLLDKLKMSSPLAYIGVLVLIFGSAAVVENTPELAEHVPWLFEGYLADAIQALVAIILSPRTKRHLENQDEASAMNVDYDD